MAKKRNFLWNSGATGATSATGYSDSQSAPYAYKVVEAYLSAGTGGATITVQGTISGGNTWHTLDTLTLSGAAGEDTSELTNAYDYIRLHIAAVTGTVVASVRSVE